MAASKVTVGVVQMSMSEAKADNVDRALGLVRQAAGRGAKLVCLPELFASRYFCQTEDERAFELSEPLLGPTVSLCQSLSKELRVALVVPVFERRAPGLYHNSCVILDESGAVLGTYRKMHIPDDPQYYEKYYFAPGDLGFGAFQTQSVTVGPLICWDQWYPEAARLTALRGAELLVYPTAIGFLPSEKSESGAAQLDAWKTIQRAHAIANGVFVVAANRVGFELKEAPAAGGSPESTGTHKALSKDVVAAGIEFWGHSFVCDPFGRVLAEAGDREEVLIADCDLSLLETTRTAWPFLRDRRIDAYHGVTARLLDS